VPINGSSASLGTRSRRHIHCNRFRRDVPGRLLCGLIWGLAVLGGGCRYDPSREEGAPAGDRADESEHAAAAADERWHVFFIKDPATDERRRAGYRHTVQREVVRDQQEFVRTVAVDRLRFIRFGRPTEIEMRAESLQSPRGQVVRFGYEVSLGPGPHKATGRIQDGQLELEITAAGTTTTRQMEWPEDCGGVFGVEQSLRREPLLPGQRRTIHVFLPMLDVVAPVELTAEDYEMTSLLQQRKRLMAVRSRASLPDGQVMEMRLWVNDAGEILKSTTDALGQQIYRTDRQTAEQPGTTAPLDVGLGVIVETDGVPQEIHQLAQMEYVVTLPQGDPSQILRAVPSQTVRTLGPHAAAVTVRAIRPDSPPAGPDAPGPPTAHDRDPSSAVQSDDPTIVALAHRVAPGESDSWRLAVALERFVHEYVESNDFSQVFATAAEVAESRQGDCTEYAVLLAALCRARNLPSRLAVGLVYVPERGGFLYHMWNTVWIGDRWIPLDATLSLGGIGAGHLTLGVSDLHDTSVYVSMLPVLQVIGRLRVEIADGTE